MRRFRSEAANQHMPFTVENASAIASMPRPKMRGELKQALTIQKLLMKDMNDEETSATARAQSARAWFAVGERVRMLLGQGAPKAVPAANDPSLVPKRRPGRATSQSAGSAPSPDAPLD